MKELTLLKEARKILSDKSRWTKGYVAIDVAGQDSLVLSERATCFCTIGAIYKAANIEFSHVDKNYPNSEVGDPFVAISELERTIKERKLDVFVDYASVAEFNDNVHNSHEDILNLIDKTIERLEEQ